MATVATQISVGKHHLTLRLTTGDGTAALVLTNAQVIAGMVAGPLKTAWSRTFVTDGVSVLSAEQNALQGMLSPSFCRMLIVMDVQAADVATSIVPQVLIVDTAGKAGVSILIGDTDDTATGFLYFIHEHTAVQ